jgi:plasmid stabilization system protein ParE
LPHVTKTARAEQDLEEIWFYVALDNVGAADGLLDEFENSEWIEAYRRWVRER